MDKKVLKFSEGDVFMVTFTNRNFLTPISVPATIMDYYATILGFMPLNEKQCAVYLKLDSKKRAGYMIKYLIKSSRLIGVPKPIIDNLISTKESYEKYKKLLGTDSDKDFNKRMADLIVNRKVEELKSEYHTCKQYEMYKREYTEAIMLLFQTFIWIANTKNERQRKIDEVFGLKTE